MTDEQLAEIIARLRRWGGDTEGVEAKKATHALPKRLWESLSSFANQPGGGVIVLGLDEQQGFRTVGVQAVAKVQADLASACDEMEPPLRPVIKVHTFEDQPVIVAEVPEVRLEQKPCHNRGSGLYSGSFLRVGDGNRQMTHYEVQTFLESRGQPRHDIEPVPGSSMADLAPELLASYLGRVRARRENMARLPDEQVLRSLHVVAPSGELTLAGVLCLTHFPQQWFPNLTIVLVQYPGTTPEELGPRGERFLDNRRFDGPLPDALKAALAAVSGAMKKRTLVQGLIRRDIPEYPPDGIREALVNAVAHRDYSMLARGSQVQVQLYQNRLEIQNPGGLFGPVNEHNLGQPGVEATRNQFLMQMLEDLGPAENRGSGIPTMMRAARELQMSPPEFRDSRTYFRVSFSNEAMLDDATVTWLNRFAAHDLSESQRLALAYTLHHGSINNSVYCLLNALDSREATQELHDLVVKQLLQQDGSRRWATYALTPAAAQAGEEDEAPGTEASRPSPRWTREERQQAIVRLIGERRQVGARAIAETLSIPRATVNYDLRLLVDAGRIERTTDDPTSRRTEYRLAPKRH